MGVVVLFGAASASAHAGGATFKVVEAESRHRVVTIRVEVRYSGDNDLAEGAFLRAVPTGPGGTAMPAVDFEREPNGVYALRANVDTDGRWVFDIASRFPPGSTEVIVDVGAEQTADREVGSRRGTDRDAGSGDSDRTVILWALATVVLVMIGVVAVLRRARRASSGRPGTGR